MTEVRVKSFSILPINNQFGTEAEDECLLIEKSLDDLKIRSEGSILILS